MLKERYDILSRWSKLILQHKEDLATIMTLENGKVSSAELYKSPPSIRANQATVLLLAAQRGTCTWVRHKQADEHVE